MRAKEPADDTAFLRVQRALSARPGATAARLVQLTGRSRSAVDYALRSLIKAGAVEAGEDSTTQCYWLTGQELGPAHGLHPPELQFLELVQRHDGISGSELAASSGWSRSEVSRIGAALADQQLIARVKQGRDMLYLPVHL